MLVVLLILSASAALTQGDAAPMTPTEAVRRDGVPNVFAKTAPGAELTIAYFGASVTNGAGATAEDKKWRWIVHHWFEAEYPQTTFRHQHVVNGGTGAHLGASRLGREVLDHNPALVFVEFSVNDGGQPFEECVKTMEGIIRQAWQRDPTTDIVILHTLNTGALDVYRKGEAPGTVQAFETVAEHYGVPTINVGWVAAQKLIAGEMTWEQFSIDTVHPTDLGYRIYGDRVTACLAEWREGAAAKPHALPEPLRADNWEDATMVHPSECVLSPGWHPETGDAFRHYPHFPDMVVADQPGENLKFTFEGTHCGLYHVVGKDSGKIEVFVDGESRGVQDLWDQWCRGGWRSSFRMVAAGLPPGKHVVELKITPDKHEESLGHAVRLGFVTLKGHLAPGE